MAVRYHIIIFLLLLSAVFTDAVGMPKKGREWAKLNLDELGAEWEEGDNEDELATPDEEFYLLSEKQKEKAMDRLNKVMNGDKIANSKEFEKLAEEADNAGKPAMIFAKVQEGRRPPQIGDGKGRENWNWDSLASLCEEWKVCILCTDYRTVVRLLSFTFRLNLD